MKIKVKQYANQVKLKNNKNQAFPDQTIDQTYSLNLSNHVSKLN